MPVVSTPYPPGTPCWVDLMAPDLQAAIDFYRDLFGWQGEKGSEEFGGYAMMSLNGKPVAGIGPAMAVDGNPPPPTVWTTYLSTDDADATATKVTANGGTLLFPVMDVGTVGRMFPAVDPTGAVFGVWQPVDFGGAEIVNEAGAVIWNELNTTDVKAAAAFYRASLGIEFVPMPDMPEYHELQVQGRTVGGAQGLGNFPPGTPAHWATYFAVDDTDSVVDAAVRADATLLAPPADTPVGRIAGLKDPQGGIFMVIKPKPFEAG